MRALSRKLSAAERSVGILPIVGFREVPEDQVFQLVFALSSNRSLTGTLQSVYQQTCSQPSLNTRVDLCRQLAEAVLHTHSLGLVHKNIRPENILLLSQSRQEGALELEPTLYVIGWQFARQVDGGATQLGGETLWERRVYQHPERQTERAEEEYCIGHDIYSFGVCMLEILTWDCLVPEENGSTEVEPSISQSFGKALIQLGANFESDHRPESTSEVAWITRDPRIVQSALRTMSETHVPVVAGRKLADLLIKCLTCLEPEGGFGDSLAVKGQDRKEVGLDFIDTILNDLRSVSSVI